ncbi:MAG: EAL domain-containing protein [Rhizobiales bacterium]|nr:EAL domain-containing protein [Hyphomicrobiales bacterium]
MSVSIRSGLVRRIINLLTRRSVLPALLALVVAVVAAIYADTQNRREFTQRTRAGVMQQLSIIRAKLQGNVNGNIQLTRGMAAMLENEPFLDQPRFAVLASRLLRDDSQIRNFAYAPDLVVSMVYPVEGNEKALGLDYRSSPAQGGAVVEARDSGKLVFTGPVDLVQGGKGLIGRFPIFIPQPAGEKRFSGILSGIIDVEKLYAQSGLYDDDLPLEVAIAVEDDAGAAAAPFFGEASVIGDDPVSVEVLMPSGSWRLYATPKGGWPASPPNTGLLWFFLALAGSLVVIPTILTGRLVEERTRNIAELERSGKELRRLSRRLELALDSSQIGVWELTTEDNSLIWDKRMNELYGFPADGGIRRFSDWEETIHPEDRERVVKEFADPPPVGYTMQLEYRLRLRDGTVRHIRESAKSYQDPGEPLRVVGVNWDTTDDALLRQNLEMANMLSEARNNDLELAKARIEFNALHDPLTKLPNRRYLDEVLSEHVANFKASSERAGLLHIDLDRFKHINDTLGHAAGDAMLVHAAGVLRSNLGPYDFVARVGGDEFVAICKTSAGTDMMAWNHKLTTLADSIVEQMQQPVNFQGHECRFGVSIGIATDLSQSANPADLLVHADIALYRAKNRGRNRHQLFNEALQEEIVTTKALADEILSGLERNEFLPAYQAQFDAVTHEVIGVEALARWQHPRKGLLAPQAFLKTAEELNVVATIDRLILEQTLMQSQEWDKAGIVVPKVSVNVSAKRLHDEELIRNLLKLKMERGRVSFELVESIFLDDSDELVMWNVEQIKELGIDVEIDDFGTGHASIVSLLKLQPSRLKIARELIMPVASSAPQRRMVRSIIEIGRSLGIEVLAEGVETMQHARVLKELGCGGLQGYAFAKPMTGDHVTDFLRATQRAKAS